VDQRGVVLERLHQIRLDRVAQQRRHRSLRLQLARGDWFLIARVANHDTADALFQVAQIVGQAQDRHDLGRDHDVKAILPRITIARAAQANGDIAQRPVIHVDHPPPGDSAHIETKRVAVVNVVVDQRREKIVCEPDRAEVAGEVQVDVFHWNHLRVTAARRAALDAKHGAKRGLTQANDRVLADSIQRIAQSHRRRGLALARWRWTDRSHQDQLAVGPVLEPCDVGERELGLVAPVGLKLVLGNVQTITRKLDDRPQRRALRDFAIAQHVWVVAFILAPASRSVATVSPRLPGSKRFGIDIIDRTVTTALANPLKEREDERRT